MDIHPDMISLLEAIRYDDWSRPVPRCGALLREAAARGLIRYPKTTLWPVLTDDGRRLVHLHTRSI